MAALATDDFNRADAATLGANWTTITGETTWKIVSNQAQPTRPSGSGDHSNFYNAVTWPDDQYSQAKIVNDSGSSAGSDEGGGLHVRAASAARTYYRCVMNDSGSSNNLGISKQVAGSYTNLGFRSQAFAANGILYFSVVGTTITVKWNGTQVGATFTDSSIASGSPGVSLSSNMTSVILDDWEGGDFSSGSLVFLPRSFPTALMVR